MSINRKDGYALLNATMAQLTGQDTFKVIDAQGFADAGKLAMTYSTDEVYNALSIVGARLLTAVRPYNAPLALIDAIDSGYFNNRIRKISYYSTKALPSGAFNTDLNTNLADGYSNDATGENPSGTADQWEQHPVHPLEMNFAQSTVWQACVTRYNDQIKIAFTSPDEWERFWGGLLTEFGNDIEQEKESHNRVTLLSRMALAAAMGESTSAIKGRSTAIDLTAAFNSEYGTNYSGEQLRTTYLKEFTQFLAAQLRIYSNMMTKRSTFFHAAPSLTLGDGTHEILRHTPKADQRLMLYTPLFEKMRTVVLSEVFNDEYLKPSQFESIDFWQTYSMDDADKASANMYITIPGWLESIITSGSTKVDTKYTFNPDYIVGCMFDRDAVLTDFQFEAARSTQTEARKNYINTWYDFGRGSIIDPSENFIVFYMSANEPEPGEDDNT